MICRTITRCIADLARLIAKQPELFYQKISSDQWLQSNGNDRIVEIDYSLRQLQTLLQIVYQRITQPRYFRLVMDKFAE